MRSLSELTRPSILDLGCGNAQLLEFFKEKNLIATMLVLTFPSPFDGSRRENPDAKFIQGDVNQLQT